jgi:hypothetical protein
MEAFEITLPLPPLLTPEQWDRAQQLLAKRRTWSKESRDARHLGAGLLFCGRCGGRLYCHGHSRRRDVYYCKSKFYGGPGCGAKRLQRVRVDAALIEIVEQYLTNPKFLMMVLERAQQPPARDTRATYEVELSKLKAKQNRLLDALEDGTIPKSVYVGRVAAIETAIRALPVPAPPAPQLDPRAIVARLVRTFSRFARLPFAEQRATLQRVLVRVPIADGAISDVTLSGAFLGQLAYTKLSAPSRTI